MVGKVSGGMSSVIGLYYEIRKNNFGPFCAEILDFSTGKQFLKISENHRKNSEGDPKAKMASQITYGPRNRSFRSCLNTSEIFMKIEKVFLIEKSRIKKLNRN